MHKEIMFDAECYLDNNNNNNTMKCFTWSVHLFPKLHNGLRYDTSKTIKPQGCVQRRSFSFFNLELPNDTAFTEIW